jgi:hypothetical protein
LNDADGQAALAICESLLLALTELKIMSEQDKRELLLDATEAHRQASAHRQNAELHRAVAAIIQRVHAGRNVGGADQDAEAYAGA